MATETEKTKIMERFDALMSGDFAKAFSRLNTDPVNMSFTDTSGNTFTVEKESGEPAVGDTASPDGTYVMENGDTIVVTGDKIESITKSEQTNPELDAANAKIAELTAELDSLKNEKTTVKTTLADFKAKENDMTKMVDELRAIKNAWKPEGRQNVDGGANKVDGVDLNRVQEIIKNKKTK